MIRERAKELVGRVGQYSLDKLVGLGRRIRENPLVGRLEKRYSGDIKTVVDRFLYNIDSRKKEAAIKETEEAKEPFLSMKIFRRDKLKDRLLPLNNQLSVFAIHYRDGNSFFYIESEGRYICIGLKKPDEKDKKQIAERIKLRAEREVSEGLDRVLQGSEDIKEEVNDELKEMFIDEETKYVGDSKSIIKGFCFSDNGEVNETVNIENYFFEQMYQFLNSSEPFIIEGYGSPVWERMQSCFDIKAISVKGFFEDFENYCKENCKDL